MTIGQQPSMTVFFEEAIREAQGLKTPEIGGGFSIGDPFQDFFIGFDDASDINDDLILMSEAQHIFSKVITSRLLVNFLRLFLYKSNLCFILCICLCQILS